MSAEDGANPTVDIGARPRDNGSKATECQQRRFAAVRTAFRMHDQNGDGLISRGELRQALQHLGIDWSDSDFEVFFQAADANGDGVLQYEEFLDWVFSAGQSQGLREVEEDMIPDNLLLRALADFRHLMRQTGAPCEPVRLVAEALTLLVRPASKTRCAKWFYIQRVLADADFARDVVEVQGGKLPDSLWRRLRRDYLGHDAWDLNRMRRASRVAYVLALWVEHQALQPSCSDEEHTSSSEDSSDADASEAAEAAQAVEVATPPKERAEPHGDGAVQPIEAPATGQKQQIPCHERPKPETVAAATEEEQQVLRDGQPIETLATEEKQQILCDERPKPGTVAVEVATPPKEGAEPHGDEAAQPIEAPATEQKQHIPCDERPKPETVAAATEEEQQVLRDERPIETLATEEKQQVLCDGRPKPETVAAATEDKQHVLRDERPQREAVVGPPTSQQQKTEAHIRGPCEQRWRHKTRSGGPKEKTAERGASADDGGKAFRAVQRGLMPSLELASPGRRAYLRQEFRFQGFIADTERRGITLPQLRRVKSYVARNCKKWVAAGGTTHLTVDAATLYDVNAWLLAPATMDNDCAFVELLTNTAQTPKWFVSHWWGEAIVEFLKCIERHGYVRGLAATDPYWICAYANRQHSLSQEITINPRDSSFFRAMQLAKGVILVLDSETKHSGPATPFARIWCCFEQTMTVDDEDKLLDMATCSGDRATILTDGVTQADIQQAKVHKCLATRRQMLREQSFPLDIIKAGLEVEVQGGKATEDSDRVHILNSICGRSLNLTPPLEEHPNYDRVNCKLRAVFAVAAWRQAVYRGMVEALRLPRALAANRWLEALQLDASDCDDLTDTEHVGQGLEGLAGLDHLTLNLSLCKHLHCLAGLGRGLRGPTKLTGLVLHFRYCARLVDLGPVFRSLPHLANLRSLELNFSNCNGLRELTGFDECVRQLTQLASFNLELQNCTDFQREDRIVNGISALSLNKFHLCLVGCVHLEWQYQRIFISQAEFLNTVHTRRLAAALAEAAAPEVVQKFLGGMLVDGCLTVDLRGEDGLRDTERLGTALAGLPDISALDLDFGHCHQLQSFEVLAGVAARVQRLCRLRLDLEACVAVGPSSVAQLATGLLQSRSILQVDLNFTHCDALPEELRQRFLSLEGFLSAAGNSVLEGQG